MKTLLLFSAPVLIWVVLLKPNKDAEAFCNCVAQPTTECEANMEELEEQFKKDPKRYKKFKKAAMKKCPEAKKYIDRMD
jgi:hypothetical protein